MKKPLNLVLLVFIVLIACVLTFTSCYADDKSQHTSTDNGEDSNVKNPSDSTSIPNSDVHVHTFGEWSITKEATCIVKGEQERVCACGEKETQEIDIADHTEGNWIIDKEATENEDGNRHKNCTVCGVTIKEETFKRYSAGISYAINSDGQTCSITGIGTCTDTEVIISEEYDGFKVTSISNYAFYNCTSLVSIVIPDSVTSICSYAFYNCSSLTNIVIPDSVTNIGELVFYNTAYYNEPSNWERGVLYINNHLIATNSELPSSYTIPNGIKTISPYAFSERRDLTSITIPDSITSICADAFDFPYLSSNLTSVYITDIEKWCQISFENIFSNPLCYGAKLYLNEKLVTDVTLSNGVMNIADYAFCNYESLTSIVISNGVKSIGSYAFSNCTSLTSITIPNSVTSIGNNAFEKCSNLESITIPDSVTTIHAVAFANCTELKNIILPNNITFIGTWTFSNCEKLTSITIPNSVTKIDYGAFENCTKLTKIIFSDSITSIGDAAFWNCASLTTIAIPDNVTSIGSCAFYGCTSLESITIPNGVTSINTSTFRGCTNLTNIMIPDSVTSIDSEAFHDCTSLKSITIPKSVTNIGDFAFSNCTSLESITIPDGVTNIGHSAFHGCSNFTSITIPDSVTTIGDGVFTLCLKLNNITVDANNSHYQSIDGNLYSKDGKTFIQYTPGRTDTHFAVPDSVTNIAYAAFSGCNKLASLTLPFVGASSKFYSGYETLFGYIFGQESYPGGIAIQQCTNFYSDSEVVTYYVPSTLKSVTITGGVVQDGAFYGCSNLSSIVMPSKLGTLSGYVFYGCSNLTSVVLPSHLTSIGACAFRDCTSLTSITIPETVTSIGDYAFYDCSSLTSITIPNSVTEIYSYAFYGCSSLTSIVLPNGITSLAPYTFYGCSSLSSVVLSSSLTYLGQYAFYSCSSLATIAIPDGIKVINRYTFYNCTSLTSVMGANSVTNIYEYAFYNCKALVTVSDWSTLCFIGESAFYDCTSLTSFTFSDTLSTLSNYVFFGCASLTSAITIPGNVSYIGEYAFYGCSKVPSVTILDGVKLIYSYAFANCSSLTSIIMPNSVESIGSSVLYGCNSLENLITPFLGYNATSVCTDWSKYYTRSDGLLGYFFNENNFECKGHMNTHVPQSLRQVIITQDATIATRAFINCSFIETIALPKGLVSIGNNAFGGCTSLTNLYVGDTVGDFMNIQFETYWLNGLDNCYIHYNAFEYGIYIPTSAIYLPEDARRYILFPLGGTVELQVLNIKTGEILPLRDTDITLEIKSGSNRISISSGRMTGRAGGEASISAYYISNGQTVYLEYPTIPLKLFVAESSNYNLSSRLLKFSEGDRDYIRMCMELYHAFYDVLNVNDIVSVDLNIFEQFLFDIDNLDDYLKGFFEGDLPKTAVLKKAFAEFISNYLDSDYAHEMAVDDTKLVLLVLEAIHEVHGDYKKLSCLSPKMIKLIGEIDDLYTTAQVSGISNNQLKTLIKHLEDLNTYTEEFVDIVDSKTWKAGKDIINKNFSNYQKAVERLSNRMDVLYELTDDTCVIVLLHESLPDTGDWVMMSVDFLLYCMSDYSHNIEIMDQIREQMISSGGYSKDDLEVHVIDELIEEYKKQWLTGAKKAAAELATTVIMNIASKNHLVAIARIASGIIMAGTSIDEQAEWLALINYQEALERCNYSIKNLYLNGKISDNITQTKQFASLYLYMLRELNSSAYTIVEQSLPSTERDQKLLSLKNNITKLDNILYAYFY